VGIAAKGPQSDDTGGVGGGEGFEPPPDDFDVALVPEGDDGDGTDTDSGDDADGNAKDDGDGQGQVVYELDTWAGATRTLLDGLLENSGIARAWEGGTLVVDVDDEEAVDDLVDQADATQGPVLDPDASKVAYGVGEWDDLEVDHLVDRLNAADIPYDWDENGDLLVLEANEDEVEEIFDAIEAEQKDADSGGAPGLQATEVLSELFVASDRLMHDAEDHEGVLSLVDASKLAERLPLPFGFDAEVWAEIVAKAGVLRAAFENDVDDDDEVILRATDLRTLLREYV